MSAPNTIPEAATGARFAVGCELVGDDWSFRVLAARPPRDRLFGSEPVQLLPVAEHREAVAELQARVDTLDARRVRAMDILSVAREHRGVREPWQVAELLDHLYDVVVGVEADDG